MNRNFDISSNEPCAIWPLPWIKPLKRLCPIGVEWNYAGCGRLADSGVTQPPLEAVCQAWIFGKVQRTVAAPHAWWYCHLRFRVQATCRNARPRTHRTPFRHTNEGPGSAAITPDGIPRLHQPVKPGVNVHSPLPSSLPAVDASSPIPACPRAADTGRTAAAARRPLSPVWRYFCLVVFALCLCTL